MNKYLLKISSFMDLGEGNTQNDYGSSYQVNYQETPQPISMVSDREERMALLKSKKDAKINSTNTGPLYTARMPGLV